MGLNMNYVNLLVNELKEIIFSYISESTLSQVSCNYFLNYAPIKYSKLFMKVRLDKYFRGVIKNDCDIITGYNIFYFDFILSVVLDNLPLNIFRKTIWYRKRKMGFWEYLNFLSLYYDSYRCRQIIVEYM